ncbi:MAG: hypothetical protein ACTSU7_01440 [Candidatus Heimdallarchaeaceae archaeon]
MSSRQERFNRAKRNVSEEVEVEAEVTIEEKPIGEIISIIETDGFNASKDTSLTAEDRQRYRDNLNQEFEERKERRGEEARNNEAVREALREQRGEEIVDCIDSYGPIYGCAFDACRKIGGGILMWFATVLFVFPIMKEFADEHSNRHNFVISFALVFVFAWVMVRLCVFLFGLLIFESEQLSSLKRGIPFLVYIRSGKFKNKLISINVYMRIISTSYLSIPIFSVLMFFAMGTFFYGNPFACFARETGITIYLSIMIAVFPWVIVYAISNSMYQSYVRNLINNNNGIEYRVDCIHSGKTIVPDTNDKQFVSKEEILRIILTK